MLGVVDSFEFVKGLPLVRWKVVESEDDLKSFGFPCYLKADVVGHKSEMEAVVRCDIFEDGLRKLKVLRKKFSGKRIVVQESFDGIEMIVGVKSDAVFGKLLMIGFGGIFAEVKRDVSFRALPVSRREIIEMIKELRGFGVFRARGKRYDLGKFVKLVEKVCKLASRIEELDLNPVVVGEKDCRIVDVRERLSNAFSIQPIDKLDDLLGLD